MIFAESPRRQTVTRLVSWGHWYAFFNIIIALVIASIYVFSAPLPSTLLGQVYLFSNWFGHISFITFIGFVLLVLPMCYAMQNARFVKGFAAFVSAVALALLAFDALLFNRTGLHLSFSSSALIVDETAVQIAHFNWQEWTFLILLFVVWLSFQILNFPENYKVTIMNTGCCGMAGSFGYEKEHYKVSMQVGEDTLFPKVRNCSSDTEIAAAGTSCRHQIFDGTKRIAKHPITLLKEALI